MRRNEDPENWTKKKPNSRQPQNKRACLPCGVCSHMIYEMKQTTIGRMLSEIKIWIGAPSLSFEFTLLTKETTTYTWTIWIFRPPSPNRPEDLSVLGKLDLFDLCTMKVVVVVDLFLKRYQVVIASGYGFTLQIVIIIIIIITEAQESSSCLCLSFVDHNIQSSVCGSWTHAEGPCLYCCDEWRCIQWTNRPPASIVVTLLYK